MFSQISQSIYPPRLLYIYHTSMIALIANVCLLSTTVNNELNEDLVNLRNATRGKRDDIAWQLLTRSGSVWWRGGEVVHHSHSYQSGHYCTTSHIRGKGRGVSGRTDCNIDISCSQCPVVTTWYLYRHCLSAAGKYIEQQASSHCSLGSKVDWVMHQLMYFSEIPVLGGRASIIIQ